MLAERRERLVIRAGQQRMMLAQGVEPWRLPLALADRGVIALRYTIRHPEWIVCGAFLLTVLRPRHVGKWIGRTLVTWQMLDRLGSIIHTPLSQIGNEPASAGVIQARHPA
jgi:hypothetical protein